MVHIAPISDTTELQYCIILVKMVPYTGTLSWVEWWNSIFILKAPDYFYRCIEEKLGMKSLEDLMRFSDSIENLQIEHPDINRLIHWEQFVRILLFGGKMSNYLRELTLTVIHNLILKSIQLCIALCALGVLKSLSLNNWT